MAVNGLNELFSILFAEVSPINDLMGYAYARAIRSHLLVQASLTKLIFSSMQLPGPKRNIIEEIISSADDSDEFDNSVLTDNEYLNIKNRFLVGIEHLHSNSLTSELWIQYFEMINLVK